MTDQEIEQRYYLKPAAAYVRSVSEKLPQNLISLTIEQLSTETLYLIVQSGIEEKLPMHRFKKTMGLARVEKVIGILQGLAPSNLLDIGTGRGVFLWPMLDVFPETQVQCVDLLENRVHTLNAVSQGGFTKLQASQMNSSALQFPDNQFDTTTALEVLEHIPDLEQTICELIRVTRRFLVFSVPSKPDNNPEHIHLLTEDRFRTMLKENGIHKVNFTYVLNHMIGVANLARLH